MHRARRSVAIELSAADLLREARGFDRAGNVSGAVHAYNEAIRVGQAEPALIVVAEAYRHLSVLHHRRNQPALARSLCQASHRLATRIGHSLLIAQALNARAGMAFEGGDIAEARELYRQALGVGSGDAALEARIEQNLGILQNIEGDYTGALEHYQSSLRAYQRAGDDNGCALAHHNLGMVHADRKLWDAADEHFSESFALAQRTDDQHLQGLCLLNHAEVHLARRLFDRARHNAEQALQLFDRIEAELDKADAYRMLGVVYRETGLPVLAEARLQAALDLARTTGSVLSEAEAAREMAVLYQEQNRNLQALTLLHAAHQLFSRLNARTDAYEINGKRDKLENTYQQVLRTWGQSIESADSYTYGHCERVATYAIAVARELGLDEVQQTTISFGAYLHDVGKVKVPHEILNKPGKLTEDEFQEMAMHPVWGVEMLDAIEFPWDIKPIIRWHHEKHDGTGYPDQLLGDDIPVTAQVVGVADVFDALTSARSYRRALPQAEALRIMEECSHHWRPDVYAAFVRAAAQLHTGTDPSPHREAA
ncbi:MAG TPA: HD domain-containing phosphohydrolase [Gemmatimonadales bacterium]|jgi:putative nucleotidyltransferase with HDIG domain